MPQLSLFSAEARPAGLPDLAGLLCGPARIARFGAGDTARLDVPLPYDDRERALVALAAARGVTLTRQDTGAATPRTPISRPPAGDATPATDGPTHGGPVHDGAAHDGAAHDGAAHDDTADDIAPSDETPPAGPAHRTTPPHCTTPPHLTTLGSAFRRDLAPLARTWSDGQGRKRVPPDFQLDGAALRLWVLAAGRADLRGGHLLLLDPDAPWTHGPLVAAATRAGLPPARLVAGEHGVPGPALRIHGARRMGRLAELVGPVPRTLNPSEWPRVRGRPAA
ncbi:hypothetical protein [Pseudonocardia phyllosphaerae]|uniref:hypothetical protein n=1 Tax=Pseudonocardia phyllosphaerae TaxID=3390502 RepID=UPI003977F82E